MIKVNLLDSVTDRAKGVAVVEEKVANPQTQTLLLALTVAVLLALTMAYDYFSAHAAKEAAQRQLAEQQRINAQMMAVNKEQADLEKQTADIKARIDAIQKLRASQQGPTALLTEVKNRFDSVPSLYFKSVTKKDGELTIQGESPDEASVTRFGQSLEFSSGLFTNLNIETQREAAKVVAANATAGPEDANFAQPEVISFTIKCTYAPNGNTAKPAGTGAPAAPGANPASTQIAQK